MLLEQFGGANGELAAAMQYSIQGLNCDDPERKDLLMDIGTEELSHLEVVGTLARMHLKPIKTTATPRKPIHWSPLPAAAAWLSTIPWEIPGRRITSRSPANSTSTCEAISRRRRGRRSSMSA